MGTRIIKDGNAYYEIDEDCLKRQKQNRKNAKAGDAGQNPARDGSGEHSLLREGDFSEPGGNADAAQARKNPPGGGKSVKY